MRGLLGRWRDEVGDTYVLGLVRAALGVLLFWHALGYAQELETSGYFGDAFHLPFIAERWVPSQVAYALLTAARLLLAVLVTVGYGARPALLGSALLAGYVLLCDRVGYHHNRYALACFSFLLAFAPCDRAFVITGGQAGENQATNTSIRSGHLWAARLAQLQLSIIYLASGSSKLMDDDWRDGLVLYDRFARYGGEALARGVPARVVLAFTDTTVTSALAKLAIATELLLAVGLWQKRTRVIALWWGVMFHLTIQITSRVEIFTWLSLSIYALFATPDVGARKLFFDRSRPKGVALAALVSMLDWLSRFEIKAWEPDALKTGHVLVVVRRDGTRATGIRAFAMVSRCVPLLFPLWAPLAFISSFTKGGETSMRA